MCGILGRVGSHPGDAQALQRGLDSLAHRGPDGEGTLALESGGRHAWLGHRRLAIIDLSEAASQPMLDPGTGNAVVFNGEIYNFRALREELQALGALFRTNSDTEVILAAYAEWGPAAFGRFAGMFAFALWDARRATLLLVRDPLGVKPLYVHAGDGEILFASEVRALLSTGLLAPRIDRRALEGYLAYGAVPSPLTMIEGVSVLPAAHYVEIGPEGVGAATRYWGPAMAPREASHAQRLPDLLREVVKDHLESDVPVGAFLSGGIDSSSLVALMSEEATVPVHTFSVTFPGETPIEAECSRLVAARYQTRHTEIPLTEQNLLAALPAALQSMDQPSVDGINVFLIARVVREAGVKVVLSGQGADEIFAGYTTFRRIQRFERVAPALRLVPRSFRRGLARMAAKTREGALMDKRIDLLASDLSLVTAYLSLRALFSEADRRALIGPAPDEVDTGLPIESRRALDDRVRGLDPVSAVSLLELSTYLENMLLRDGDVMSMASSVEVRVPFLDHRLVSFVAALPGEIKLSSARPKPLLLDAMGDRLPRKVWDRPKTGFTLPWETWLRGALREDVETALGRDDAGIDLGFVRGSVQRVWQAFLARDPSVSWSRVWALYVLLRWCDRIGLAAPPNSVVASTRASNGSAKGDFSSLAPGGVIP